MVLMSGGFVINDVVWEFHETTLEYIPETIYISGRIWYDDRYEQPMQPIAFGCVKGWIQPLTMGI